MKMWMRPGLRALIIFAVLVTAFLCVTRAVAVNDSLWVNTGAVTKTLVAENITSDNSPYFQRSCDKVPQKINKYGWNGSSHVKTGQIELTNNCWTKTAYGLYGTGNDGEFIRAGDTGTVAWLSMPSPYNRIALPDSDKLIITYGNGTSTTRDWYIYDSVSTSLKHSIGSDSYGRVVDRYTLANDASYWVLKTPGTNQNMGVNQSGYSNNGKWVVVHANAQGYMKLFRLNLDTKELLPFAQPLPNGADGNPNFALAISNDGRYVTSAINDGNFYQFVIYDLSTCVLVPDKPLDIATGCTKRNVRSLAMPDATYNEVQQYVEFSDTGESIMYSYYANGMRNRYMITAPGKDVHLLEYLALGDSFSSGEGDTDGRRYYLAGTDGNGELINDTGITDFPYWKEKCHLSMRSYPYLLANTAGLTSSQFRSVACSGAKINNIIPGSGDVAYNGHFNQLNNLLVSDETRSVFTNRALTSFIPGRAAQIEFVQKYKPGAVTIGIGGNDINFGKKLAECILPTSTCRYASTDRAETGKEIARLYDQLVDAYSRLKAASPATRFYAIGYPQLVTGGGSCGANVLLDEYEREYAIHVVDYLNRTIAAAAAKSGIHYLDIKDSLAGKNLCSSAEKIAVNGIARGDDRLFWGGEARNFGFWGNESYHPNDLGQSLMADALEFDLNNTHIHEFNPCAPNTSLFCVTASNSKPAIPAYFGTSSKPQSVLGEITVTANPTSLLPAEVLKQGVDVVVSTSQQLLKAATTVQLTLYSEPVNLGQATVGADGKVSTTIEIPAGTLPGYHTLHMVGTTPSNDSVDYYRSIFVYADEDDLDGDGISNQDDTCGPLALSGMDMDGDSVDDVCDRFVGQIEPHPLYRVRLGNEDKGEIDSRFYIERDVLEAKSKLNIVNDHDPDGDGWAIVGHTEIDDDGKIQTQFWIDDAKTPHLLLNGEDSATCAQLTPVSLGVVMQGEDRLLQPEQDNPCPDPEPAQVSTSLDDSNDRTSSIDGGVTLGDSIINPQPTATSGVVQLAVASLSRQSFQSTGSALVAVHQHRMTQEFGHVASTLTARVPSYFDSPGKNSADVAGKVSNVYLIGGIILLAVLSGIVLLIRLVVVRYRFS